MIVELSLLAASGLCMVGLLVHKNFEASRGANAAVLGIRQKTDPILQSAHHTTGRFFSYFTLHNVLLIANYFVVYVVRFFMNVSRRIHDFSSHIVEKASKKTEDLSRGGAASFYLKKIKEGKEETNSK